VILKGVVVRICVLGMLICSACASDAQDGPKDLNQQIDDFVQQEMERGHIPGLALAVVQQGNVVKLSSYGTANLELGVPVTEHSVFELASLTKQFTGAVIAMLAEEGEITLDDSLHQYIDDIPEDWRAITIRQLLSHSAGMVHRFEKTYDGVFLMDYSTESMLDAAKKTPLNSTPGTDWKYSDKGYFLLGIVIEHVTGQSFEAVLKERFFDPLDMTETYLLNQAQIIPNRVAGYTIEDSTLQNIRRDWQFGLTPHFGVMSSVFDMVKWEQSLVNGSILSEKMLAAFWSPLYVFREDAATESVLGYGYGWWVNQKNGRRFVEHSGFTGTSYFRDLKTGLAVIVLTNRDQASGPGTIGIAHGIAHIIDPTINTDVQE